METGTSTIQNTDRRKLAALLDIDTSQPDVFETPEPTSSTDNVTPPIADTENENIVAKKLNSNEAYSKFQDKQLDTDKSDNNAVRRKKQPAVHYEIGATGNEVVETPTEKFNRLKFEFKSFLDELNNTKAAREVAAQKGNPNDFIPFSEDTYSELQKLSQSLNQLGSDPNYETILSGKGIKYEMDQSAKLQDQITKKLISQLKAFQSGQTQSNTAAPASGSPSANNNVVTYELFYSNDMQKNNQATKVAALEKRITELEVLLGRNALPGSSDLISAVDQLKEQVTLLATPNHLEILERKLKTVTQELQQFAETTKNQPPPTINEKKVNDLFELVGRWDNVATQLPGLVSRLQALKTLHEESTSFANTVHQLEQQQDEIKTLLKNDGELLSKVDTGLVSNMNTIQSNISVIEKRFSELSKKIEQLGLQTF